MHNGGAVMAKWIFPSCFVSHPYNSVPRDLDPDVLDDHEMIIQKLSDLDADRHPAATLLRDMMHQDPLQRLTASQSLQDAIFKFIACDRRLLASGEDYRIPKDVALQNFRWKNEVTGELPPVEECLPWLDKHVVFKSLCEQRDRVVTPSEGDDSFSTMRCSKALTTPGP